MALKTIVKVGSITNLSDARYCAGMGVDMLGFSVVEGRESYVTPTFFKEMRGWFSGPLVVAEVYGAKSREDLERIIQTYMPDRIELSIQELSFTKPEMVKLILSINGEEWTRSQSNLETIKNQIAYLLVPSSTDTSTLKNMANHFSILIQANATSYEDSESEGASISGISLQGGSEERPGFKNYDELSQILEKLEVEN